MIFMKQLFNSYILTRMQSLHQQHDFCELTKQRHVTQQVLTLGQNRTEILCEAFLFQHFFSVLDDLNIHSLASIEFFNPTRM